MKESPFASTTLAIRTLTPVHIRGNTLIKDMDFYLDKGNLHRINYLAFLQSIPKGLLGKSIREIKQKGLRSLLPRPIKKEKPSQVEAWKVTLREKAGLSLPGETEPDQNAEQHFGSELFPLLQQAELYDHDMGSERENGLQKIYGNALDSYWRTYLPGSTLKGAIRTAFYMHALLKDPSCLARLRFTWSKDPLQADYPLNLEMNGLDIDSENFGRDIFSQLTVRDSGYLSHIDSLGVFPVKIMNIVQHEDREFIAWKSNDQQNIRFADRVRPFYWEMIRPGATFQTEIVFNSEPGQTSSSPLELNLQNMMEALHTFSSQIITKELQYAEKYDISYLKEFYQDLKAKCEADQTNIAYLPVGSGLPWHAKTIGGILDPASLKGIRCHFYRHMGKFRLNGRDMKRERFRKFSKKIKAKNLECVEPFPKTRHVVFQEGQPYSPPGWVQLELK